MAVSLGEAPFAGYPASGWKPQGAAFNLPSEYGPPPAQQEQKEESAEVEITQERLEYAGQLGETTTFASPSNEYLPANTDFPVS